MPSINSLLFEFLRGCRSESPRVHSGASQIAVERVHPRTLGALILAIAGVWTVAPLRALLVGEAMSIPDLGEPSLVLSVAIGGIFALWGLDHLIRRQQIVIAGGMVRVLTRSVAGVERWHEPLTNYLGLHLRCRRIRHRYGWRMEYRIELVHLDRSKVVILLQTRDRGLAEACWSGWAERVRGASALSLY
jgi:hypothetical protein